MKETKQTVTVYTAEDGTKFLSKTECSEYEIIQKEALEHIKYYNIYYQPDLTETGQMTKCLRVAVYVTNKWDANDVANNYAIKKFGYLQEGVQGWGFTRSYRLEGCTKEEFFINEPMKVFGWRPEKCDRIFISPIEFNGFSGIERYDYMKEWKFK